MEASAIVPVLELESDSAQNGLSKDSVVLKKNGYKS